jgi:hypothetical protein
VGSGPTIGRVDDARVAQNTESSAGASGIGVFDPAPIVADDYLKVLVEGADLDLVSSICSRELPSPCK